MVPCFFCDEEEPSAGCRHCKGTGFLQFATCPRLAFRADQGLRAFFDCYDFLQMGVLPAQGGLVDQSQRFLTLVHHANHFQSELEKKD